MFLNCQSKGIVISWCDWQMFMMIMVVIIVVFLFIVTVLGGNCNHIIPVLNHTISSFSFSCSKSFC